MDRFREICVRLLLLPNILCLDAPVVALVWMHAIANRLSVTLSDRAYWLMSLAVWVIYFADRWLDQSRRQLEETERHAVHSGFNRSAKVVVAIVLMVLFKDALVELNSIAWMGGSVLVILTVGYFYCVHDLGESFPKALPKELWVGIVFAAGCALVPWSLEDGNAQSLPLVVICLGWLFFLNCAAITRWENLEADRTREASLLNTWPIFLSRLGLTCLLSAAFFVIVGLVDQASFSLYLSMAMAAVMLGALEQLQVQLGKRVLRVAADAVLLTPLLFVFFD